MSQNFSPEGKPWMFNPYNKTKWDLAVVDQILAEMKIIYGELIYFINTLINTVEIKLYAIS